MKLKFKWQPGDIAIVTGDNKVSSYYIIRGTTELGEKQAYPTFLGKKFGTSRSGKFIGYHTKAFHQIRERWAEGDLWFEGMQYLWNTTKLDLDKLTGPKKQAYEAALEDTEFEYQQYYEAQIKYIFIDSSRTRK